VKVEIVEIVLALVVAVPGNKPFVAYGADHGACPDVIAQPPSLADSIYCLQIL
jgi:hypothetical protein